MTLNEYRHLHRHTYSELAALIGVECSYAQRLCKGEKMPSSTVAARISAATNGEVTVAELLYPDGLPEGARLVAPSDGASAAPEEAA
jgi:DNA-binding transcriptional regulator YdaS (Cro superfamily)